MGQRVVYDLNKKVRVGTSEWNVDMVLGPPASESAVSPTERAIFRAQPSTFRIACEAKSIMTEHRKAQRNRQRDLDALHQFLHRYDQNTIVASVTVVNIAESFRSPLRGEKTKHKNPASLVSGAVELLRMIPVRSQSTNGPGLEANSVIVLNYDNASAKRASHVYTKPPAPQSGDPLHWESFIRRICDLYVQRWGR